eukprot:6256-Heterococcus_DN1.PRE.6
MSNRVHWPLGDYAATSCTFVNCDVRAATHTLSVKAHADLLCKRTGRPDSVQADTAHASI